MNHSKVFGYHKALHESGDFISYIMYLALVEYQAFFLSHVCSHLKLYYF